jgi:tRNA splicing ligase
MSLSDQVTTRFGMNVEYVSTIRKIMSENTKCIHVIKGNICSRHIVLYYIFSENVLFVDRCLSFWPLSCLSFFDLRIMITSLFTSLVSSNSS